MKNSKNIEKYDGTLEELGKEAAMMAYDSLASLLRHITDDLKRQSVGDREKGRVKLASSIEQAVEDLSRSADHVDDAWEVCKHYMKDEL